MSQLPNPIVTPSRVTGPFRSCPGPNTSRLISITETLLLLGRFLGTGQLGRSPGREQESCTAPPCRATLAAAVVGGLQPQPERLVCRPVRASSEPVRAPPPPRPQEILRRPRSRASCAPHALVGPVPGATASPPASPRCGTPDTRRVCPARSARDTPCAHGARPGTRFSFERTHQRWLSCLRFSPQASVLSGPARMDVSGLSFTTHLSVRRHGRMQSISVS